jgi:hypothetical protein
VSMVEPAWACRELSRTGEGALEAFCYTLLIRNPKSTIRNQTRWLAEWFKAPVLKTLPARLSAPGNVICLVSVNAYERR